MKLLFVLLLLSVNIKAESYRIGGENINFEIKQEILISRCEGDCEALKKINQFRSIDLRKARAQEQFVGSIGSDVCKLIYKARSVLGTASNRDQRAFCYFDDGSLVEINSLSEYLKTKKLVTP